MPNLITQFFSVDHDRLDFLFHMYQQAKETDKEAAIKFFDKFSAGLKRHIEWEENLLFPAFDDALGTHGFGPTAVMRTEHDQIKSMLEQIHSKLNLGQQTDAIEQALLDILQVHNTKEENILYVECDRVLTEQHTAALFLSV